MSQLVEETPNANMVSAVPTVCLDSVVTGLLSGFNDSGDPLVVFAANPQSEAMAARSTVTLYNGDIGAEVALLFEDGDLKRPLIIGLIHRPKTVIESPIDELSPVEIDAERLILNAGREIVLRCGQASITLTRAGKIIIRGAYLSSQSSGVNRIKGGSVQIN